MVSTTAKSCQSMSANASRSFSASSSAAFLARCCDRSHSKPPQRALEHGGLVPSFAATRVRFSAGEHSTAAFAKARRRRRRSASASERDSGLSAWRVPGFAIPMMNASSCRRRHCAVSLTTSRSRLSSPTSRSTVTLAPLASRRDADQRGARRLPRPRRATVRGGGGRRSFAAGLASASFATASLVAALRGLLLNAAILLL